MFILRKKEKVINRGRVLLFVNGRIEEYLIESENEGIIKAGEKLLPMSEAQEFFSPSGDRFMIFNMSVEANTEAEVLYNMRENELVKGLFDAHVPKKLSEYMPIIVIGVCLALSIMFRGH